MKKKVNFHYVSEIGMQSKARIFFLTDVSMSYKGKFTF